MIQIKVHGETPKSGKSLCHSCKHAKTVKGQNCQEFTKCTAELFGATRHMVPFKVAECAEYHPSTMPWLHEMESMAWIVQARKRGPSGFSNPAEGEMEITIEKPRDSGSPTSVLG